MNRILLSLIVFLLMNQAPLPAQNTDPDNDAGDKASFTPDASVVYKETPQGELKLNFFYPEGHSKEDKTPAIVFFFGGGWTSGSPQQFFPHCDYLASRGMVAISAQYRIKNKHDTTPQDAVRDAKSAMRWLRSHASEYGIDPERIAAGGGSAGGHLAANTPIEDFCNEPGEDTTVSSRPSALVLFNPVIDSSPQGYGNDRMGPDWKEVSPLHHVDENTPPVIVFLGTKDKLIPVSMVEGYQRSVEDAGGRCEVRLYKGQPHGFFNYNKPKYYYETVIEMDKFLASLGYIEGEPTLQKP